MKIKNLRIRSPGARIESFYTKQIFLKHVHSRLYAGLRLWQHETLETICLLNQFFKNRTNYMNMIWDARDSWSCDLIEVIRLDHLCRSSFLLGSWPIGRALWSAVMRSALRSKNIWSKFDLAVSLHSIIFLDLLRTVIQSSDQIAWASNSFVRAGTKGSKAP